MATFKGVVVNQLTMNDEVGGSVNMQSSMGVDTEMGTDDLPSVGVMVRVSVSDGGGGVVSDVTCTFRRGIRETHKTKGKKIANTKKRYSQN